MVGKVYRTIGVETQRGCPHRCTFCNSPGKNVMYEEPGTGKFYRRKSVKKIQKEIEYYQKHYQVEYFYFVADTFLAMDSKTFQEFVEMYSSVRLPFWMNSRPETLTFDRIRKLEFINCHRMNIGLEHGNEDFRKKVLKKAISNAKLVKCITSSLQGTSISVVVNNIIGFPDETRELAFETIALNKQIRHVAGNKARRRFKDSQKSIKKNTKTRLAI